MPGERHADRVERFRAVYDAAYPRVMAYVMRRVRTQDDVHDVVSEVFLVAWRRLDEVPAEPMPWFFGVARRALANHYRAHTRREALERRVAREPRSVPGEFDAVHQALDRLSDDDREILRLAAWEDLDNDEIAAALRITPAAVAVRLHRARKRLERDLDRSTKRMKSGDPSRTPGGVYGTQSGKVQRE